jgi:hypothetical protein
MPDDDTLRVMAVRLQAVVFSAMLNTSLEEELEYAEQHGFVSPVERDLWIQLPIPAGKRRRRRSRPRGDWDRQN